MKADIGFEIKNVSHLIKRKMESAAAIRQGNELTGMHGWFIGYIYALQSSGKEVFQRDLEEKFQIRRSTASEILKLMEKNGLITRCSVPYDARLKKLTLTPKALEVHARVVSEMEKMEAKLSEGLSQQELDAFFAIMDKIKANLDK